MYKYDKIAVDKFWASHIRAGTEGILSLSFRGTQKKKLHRVRRSSDCFPDTIVIRPHGILSA